MNLRHKLQASILVASLATLVLTALPSHASDSWKIGDKSFKRATAGYLSKVSILPGAPLQAFVTCNSASYSLELFRMGYYDGAEALSVSKSASHPCTHQKMPVRQSNFDAITAHWVNPVSLDTSNVEPGFYLVKIWASNGTAAFMPLVVRSPSVEGAVVISMPNMTSLAYNKWGGASSYMAKGGFENRARKLSFNLPLQQGFGSGIYLNYMHPLLMLASSLDIKLAYVSDVDVATIPNVLKGAKSYISGGHDEYWTQEERNAVLKARTGGTNLIFFGANVAYWRVRLTGGSERTNPDMEIYKSQLADPDKSLPTIRFRDTGAHEQTLTGLQYRCFPATGDLTVKNASSFIFENTGVANGEKYSGLIGPEVDSFTGPKFFPGKITVIASSPVDCGRTKKSNAHSEIVYGVDPSNGAATISVGTMNWVTRGLSSEAPPPSSRLAITMTENILRAANVGPIGLAHPIPANELSQ